MSFLSCPLMNIISDIKHFSYYVMNNFSYSMKQIIFLFPSNYWIQKRIFYMGRYILYKGNILIPNLKSEYWYVPFKNLLSKEWKCYTKKYLLIRSILISLLWHRKARILSQRATDQNKNLKERDITMLYLYIVILLVQSRLVR